MKLMHPYTLDDLMTGCKAGDRKMQELLYKQTAPKMLAICMRYAKDRMEAEDVLQMGYIKIFQKIEDFRGDGSFEGWMRRIMVHTAIESYRKNSRALKIVEIDAGYEQIPADSGNYLEAFSTLGMKDLMKIIQKLADGYRIVFNMYVIEGYTHKEIATELGIAENTSKTQLFRARAILKQEIIKMEGFGYATYTG
ncbi:RNA polymerase sigma factor [Pedobacter changchengzhani]|uniref:RNA polymerase sigma factor n=1 Tax=Pedobacter changchengzhani TaxID=2529274 RepID=A0A4R5MIR7_9SPHI|nr:RNA polymerase sigma factor [Pedobacter changchengzhani]TDG35451.1 RNA polymerase sigma factor [Pedobacter changchengzhani]